MADICDENSPIVCELPYLSPEQLFRKLILRDENGCPALNTVTVEPSDVPCETFINCDNATMPWETLVKKMIILDENGCYAVRIIDSNGV